MQCRAVLVGINKYDQRQLYGSINDIDGMRQLLVEVAQWADADIHVLTNEAASKSAIVTELRWLTAGLTSGDRALFHFSGHGDCVPSGGATYDSLLPHDFSGDLDTALSANDFKALDVFGAVPDGVLVTWIADACYSAGIITFMNRVQRLLRLGSSSERLVAPRTVPPSTEAVRLLNQGAPRFGLTGSNGSPLNVAMISASDDQAADNPTGDVKFQGTPYGALTYYLLSVLRDQQSRQKPLQDFCADVVNALRKFIPNQRPTLHGNPALWLKPFLGGIGPAPFQAHRFDVSGEPLT